MRLPSMMWVNFIQPVESLKNKNRSPKEEIQHQSLSDFQLPSLLYRFQNFTDFTNYMNQFLKINLLYIDLSIYLYIDRYIYTLLVLVLKLNTAYIIDNFHLLLAASSFFSLLWFVTLYCPFTIVLMQSYKEN